MRLIRVGKRRINIEFLIMDEKTDDAIRVHLESGQIIELTGKDAEDYDRQVEAAICHDPAEKTLSSAQVGHAVGPGRGAGESRVRKQGKRSG